MNSNLFIEDDDIVIVVDSIDIKPVYDMYDPNQKYKDNPLDYALVPFNKQTPSYNNFEDSKINDGKVFIYASSYNINHLRLSGGLAGLRFSS